MVVQIDSRPMRSWVLLLVIVHRYCHPKLLGDCVFGLEKELKVSLAGLPKTFDNCDRKQEIRRKIMHPSNTHYKKKHPVRIDSQEL